VLARLGRRHSLVGVVGRHPPQGFALLRLEGDERRLSAQLDEEPVLGVETQFSLALLIVGAVTIKAVLRQDGPNVAAENDLVVAGRPRPTVQARLATTSRSRVVRAVIR
jgi:hypothetical protein